MGERKKKKRSQLREVIVPLPLASTFNRLANRAAKQQCTLIMNVRKTDLKEADLAIGLFFRSGRRFGLNEFWRTTLTLEQVDENKTRIDYSPVRLSVTIGVQALLPLMLPVLCLLTLCSSIFPVVWLSEAALFRSAIFVGLVIVLLLYIRHRRQVLVNLLHNLDKPLGE